MNKKQLKELQNKQKLSNTVFTFLSTKWNVYGLTAVYFLLISSILWNITTTFSYLVILICIACLNFVFYLLGCKNSAVWYTRNMNMLFDIMEIERDQKKDSSKRKKMN
jgi:hypothetical protein